MIKTVLFRLGHLGFLIGWAGASIVFSFNVLSGHQGAWLGPVFAFLMVFVVYNFDHLRDSQRTDKSSTPLRSQYMYRYERLFRFLIGMCALGFFILALAYRPFFIGVGIFYVLSGAFYVMPWLPGKRIKRLKDIPFFKNVYVPLCWLILILYSQVDLRHPNAAVGMAVAYFLVRLLVSVTTGDIRDLKADKEAGMKTIAIWVGRKNAGRFLQSLNILSIGMILFACLRHIWPVYALIMIVPVVYIMVLLRILDVHPGQGEFVSEIYDFEFISYGPILLISCFFQ
jgi:4-hydroxybenzoate polyprenyltransferase